VGSAYGAVLSRENDVLLVGREKHVNAINKAGLSVEGDFAGSYSPAATVHLEEIPPEALLVVATKAYDLAQSLATIQSTVQDDTTILLIQNGLGIEELARRMLNKHCAIERGIVAMASEMLGPGQIRVRRGPTFLDDSSTSKRIFELLERSNLTPQISSDFKREVWIKCVVNCVINPLSAILQVRNNLVGRQQLAWIRHSIVKEAMAVGVAEGIDFGIDLIELIDEIIPRYNNRSSMLQDIEKGRPTEIDYINGRIVELGKRHSIGTPVNKCLTQLVQFLEEK
jgi:2-dehydropantoate 2-reductase